MLQKNHSQKIIGFLLVLVFISALYYVYKKKLSNVPLVPNAQENNSQDNSAAVKNTPGSEMNSSEQNSESILENDNSDEIEPADGQRSDEKPDEALRQAIISYFNKKLNEIVPPPAKDKWDIPIFYFVGNSQVYIELYGLDTDLVGLKILYKVEKAGNDFKITELARYKEDVDDFTLVSGQDNLGEYVKEEYDYNEDTSKWEKFDEFTEGDMVNEEDLYDESTDLDEDSDSTPTVIE